MITFPFKVNAYRIHLCLLFRPDNFFCLFCLFIITFSTIRGTEILQNNINNINIESKFIVNSKQKSKEKHRKSKQKHQSKQKQRRSDKKTKGSSEKKGKHKQSRIA